ncbi:hypothetical protein EVAR_65970_1 [Eumeta japonica]|uniref:Uncharacterized protein n=1 Tax=Eumeta variegata TaxID=151549 RepID=A0A4C1ZAY9_EUMVA|nr:hypothetical protein EVAR_65970_1 [Eumeta japonica]
MERQIRGSAVGCMLHVNACCRQASFVGLNLLCLPGRARGGCVNNTSQPSRRHRGNGARFVHTRRAAEGARAPDSWRPSTAARPLSAHAARWAGARPPPRQL